MTSTRCSVVIASRQSADELDRCLEALAPQAAARRAEVVVARDPDAGELSARALDGSWFRLVWGPAGATIPVLRGLGLAETTGDPVAITEDHLVPAEDWLDQLIAGIESGYDAVGGVMVNGALGRLVDWAAYFSDYGFYSVGRTIRQSPPLLTAANAAYRRAVVPDVAAWCQEGAWENVVHDRLAAAGRRVGFWREARMIHDHRYRFGAFWGNRYSHGRDYASSRRQEDPTLNRWVRALTAPLLAPVLFGRIARDSWREAPGAFLAAAPITIALVSGWAIGEMAGYLGRSPR